MNKKETDDAAERQKRLQTLRSKQKEQPAKPGAASLGGSGSDGGDTSGRKREFIKKMMKKRMQEGGAGSAGGPGKAGGNAEQFPRLKSLLKQGGGQAGETSSVKLEDLETRVTKLEQALEKMLEMFEKETK